MRVTPNKIFFLSLVLVFVSITSIFGTLITRTHRIHSQFKKKEEHYQASINAVTKRINRKEVYLSKLSSDPEFVDRVVRKRLGYSAENEIIFRFPKENF